MSSSTSKQKSKRVRPPIPLDVKEYPSRATRFRWDLSNWLFNRLYPVKPWLFGASAIGSFAYFNRAPDDSFPLNYLAILNNDGQDAVGLPWSDSELLRLLKLAGLSLLVAYVPVFLLRNVLLRWFIFRYKGFLKEDPKRPSLTSKVWGICYKGLKILAPPRLETCDAFLPKQPVPSLAKTLERYLESVECILSEEEFDQVKSMAASFQRGEGRWLQMLCGAYSLFTESYVTGFWEKYAYLYSRKPVLVHSSVAHVDLVSDVPANRAVRAAHITHLEALHMLAIVRQRIRPLGSGLVYSGHYKKMYCTSRVPGETVDHIKQFSTSKHVAVYLKGLIYTVDAFDEQNQLYSVEQLTQIFTELLQRGDTASGVKAQLPLLTHDTRDSWHRNRQRFFVEHPRNKQLLEKVESAIVFFIFDERDFDYTPKDPAQMDFFMRNMLAGDIRWADKSLNYIISRNGRAGGTTEHSIGDGAEFSHIFENFVATDMDFMTYPDKVEDIDKMDKLVPDKGLKLAQKLDFDISKDMESEIERSAAQYHTLQSDLDLVSLIFTDFGKGLIKQGGCSPDAFLQMAIQLANFKQKGKFVLTYESASSRFFANSRTETLRTVSKDSCAFVKAMLDGNCNKADRLKLLQTACQSHHSRNRDMMLGKGVDRHLFVLFVLSKAVGKQSNFLNYYINQPWTISSSQLPTVTNQVDEDKNVGHTWLGASFGPQCPEGYGVCYRFAGNHSICIHITSFKSAHGSDSNDFRALLQESFHEMAALFKEEIKSL